jgi:hypothetical protein
MPVAKKVSEEGPIDIKGVDIVEVNIGIVGTSRLVVNRFSAEALAEMEGPRLLAAETPAKKKVHKVRDPISDTIGAMNVIGPAPVVHNDHPRLTEELLLKWMLDSGETDIWFEGKFGMASTAFKSAMVNAGVLEGIFKTRLRPAFHVTGDLVEITCAPGPYMRIDAVRNANGSADVRYRGDFREWSAVLPFRFDPSLITAKALIHLVQKAGVSIGVGNFRPSGTNSSGTWGTWKLKE